MRSVRDPKPPAREFFMGKYFTSHKAVYLTGKISQVVRPKWHTRSDCAAIMRARDLVEGRMWTEEGGREYLYSGDTGTFVLTRPCGWCIKMDNKENTHDSDT